MNKDQFTIKHYAGMLLIPPSLVRRNRMPYRKISLVSLEEFIHDALPVIFFVSSHDDEEG